MKQFLNVQPQPFAIIMKPKCFKDKISQLEATYTYLASLWMCLLTISQASLVSETTPFPRNHQWASKLGSLHVKASFPLEAIRSTNKCVLCGSSLCSTYTHKALHNINCCSEDTSTHTLTKKCPF